MYGSKKKSVTHEPTVTGNTSREVLPRPRWGPTANNFSSKNELTQKSFKDETVCDIKKENNVQIPEMRSNASREEPEKPNRRCEPAANNFSFKQQLEENVSKDKNVYDWKNNIFQVPEIRPNTSREKFESKTKSELVANIYSFAKQFEELKPQIYKASQDVVSCVPAVPTFPSSQIFQNTQSSIFNRHAPILNSPAHFIFPTMNQNMQTRTQQTLGNIQPELNIKPNDMQGRSCAFDSSMNFIALETPNSGTNMLNQNYAGELQVPKKALKLQIFLRKRINEINHFCLAPDPMQSILQVLKKMEIELHQTQNPDQLNFLQRNISDAYRKLHIFLFGCYKIKDGKKHFDVLNIHAQILQKKLKKRELYKDSVIGSHILAEIQDSYSYIFGSEPRNLNYDLLLQQTKSFSLKRKRVLSENFTYFLKRYNKNLHKKSDTLFRLHGKIEKFKCCSNDIDQFRKVFNNFKRNFRSNGK